MTLSRRLIVVFSGVLLAWAPVAAQNGEPFRASAVLEEETAPKPPRTAQNAAWAYYKAWDTITTQDERVKFVEATGERPKVGEPLTAAQRAALEKHRAYLDGVMLAASMEQCDWGSRTDAGLGALIPHLGYLRQSARVLALDARRAAQDGNSVAAAERIVAMIGLSRHAATDHYLISKLVAVAIGHLACTVTEEMIRSDQLTPAAARLVLTAIREVSTPDLYRVSESIDRERRVTLDWFRKECVGPDVGKKFGVALSTAGSLRGDATPRNAVAATVAQFTEQRVQSEIERADRFYDAVEAAWKKPNAAAVLDELETQAAEYQWGLVTYATRGAFGTVRRSIDRMAETYKSTSGKLRAVLEAADQQAPR